MGWLRRWMRRNTRPITKENAEYWKGKLSIVYAICAWHIFGFTIYGLINSKLPQDPNLSIGQRYAEILNIDLKTHKLHRITGFTYSGVTNQADFDENKAKLTETESTSL
ncbi:uncharacterized protein LOC105702368 [Orussus abietinus]|uniref:uncharacterized protein LOC105702368 n=1 Tax=Orussus abietinus TaxID=222816 RepID=UPI0006268B2F|nr:uncharacterized protein LOC105702368 [Orussus abietinus]